MDPDATYKIVLDVTLDLDERAEAALNMLVWLAKGGSGPRQDTGEGDGRWFTPHPSNVAAICERVIIEQRERFEAALRWDQAEVVKAERSTSGRGGGGGGRTA